MIKICRECSMPLSDDENHYYGGRCEQCVRDWHQEITEWRFGGENEKFDKQFGEKKVIH